MWLMGSPRPGKCFLTVVITTVAAHVYGWAVPGRWDGGRSGRAGLLGVQKAVHQAADHGRHREAVLRAPSAEPGVLLSGEPDRHHLLRRTARPAESSQLQRRERLGWVSRDSSGASRLDGPLRRRAAARVPPGWLSQVLRRAAPPSSAATRTRGRDQVPGAGRRPEPASADSARSPAAARPRPAARRLTGHRPVAGYRPAPGRWPARAAGLLRLTGNGLRIRLCAWLGCGHHGLRD